MDDNIYRKCSVCQGVGISVPVDKSGPTTRCYGCQGSGYQVLSIPYSRLEKLEIDAKEAHLFYRADGSCIFVNDSNHVRDLRIASAKKIDILLNLCQEAGIAIPANIL
jgi:hypothetical protein